MKKNITLKKKVIHNIALKSFKLKIRSREKKKMKRRLFQGYSRDEIRTRLSNEARVKQYKHLCLNYKYIKAPRCLSMVENPEGTLEFISALEKSLQKKEKVFIKLRNVYKIASGAIIVLLSIMFKFKNQKVDFNVDSPKSQDARRALHDSGFFEYLNENKEGQINLFRHKGIYTHSNKTVDSDLSDSLISVVSKMIWGETKRCPGVQRTYLELMQNTNNHASLSGTNEHHWYTTVTYNKEKNKACFSFIDYGVGIIESIKKNEKGKFWTSLKDIFSVLKPQDSGEFIKLLLDGSIHKTATGYYYRGKGLPGIYKAFQDNKISNLVIITNDALADCKNNLFHTLKNKLVGTYIYWELNENNKKLNVV